MSLRKTLTSILSRIGLGNSQLEKTSSDTKKTVEEILEEERNNLYESLLKNIEDFVEAKHGLDKPNTSKNKSNNRNNPDEEYIILDSLENGIMNFFMMIYLNSINVRDRKKAINKDGTIKINENLFRKIFEKFGAYKNTLEIIQSAFGLTLQKIFSVKKVGFISEEREKSKGKFEDKLIEILEFTKENSDKNIQEILNRFNFENIYCLENANILMEVFFYLENPKSEEFINKDTILNIVAIIIYQLNISTILSLTSKNTLSQANNYIAMRINPIDYYNFIYYNGLFFDYLKIIESVIASNETISKLPSKNELLKAYIENTLKREISGTDFSKFSKSGIYENIKILDKNRKIFILKIIFSDINIFCKLWDFINEELFSLLIEIDEKRFKEILKLFEKGLKSEELKIIIENELEIFINNLSKGNIKFFFKLLSLGMNISDLKELGNDDFDFIGTLEINSKEGFYEILEIIAKNGKNYKNIILNTKLKQKVLEDLDLLSRDIPGYDELLDYINQKNFLQIDHNIVISKIKEIYVNFGLEYILKDRRKLNTQSHNTFIASDLEEMINSLNLPEDSRKIINRILNLLNKNDGEYFILLWLEENDVNIETLQKILDILSILREFGIESYEIDKILENLPNIVQNYLRNILENVKFNNINGRIKELVLTYIYTLEKDVLNEYVRQNSEVKILVKLEMTELDDYLDSVIRSGNDAEIESLGALLEKMLNNIFEAYDFRITTSTRGNIRFGNGCGSFVASTKSPIFGWLKKRPDEGYYDYLVRIEGITLIDLLPDEIKSDYYLNVTYLLAKNLGHVGLFAFLETFSENIITKVRGKDTDLTGLGEYFNGTIGEETTKLKKSLNI